MITMIQSMLAYPGIDTARWVAEHADPRSESPLESLGRMAFLSAGRIPPLSNIWITVGGKWFRVDHLLPETGVVIEADGAIKYNNRPDAGQQVMVDRERERLLRQLGFVFVRYDWAIASHAPAELMRRVDEAARTRPLRPVPTSWTLEPPWSTGSAGKWRA